MRPPRLGRMSVSRPLAAGFLVLALAGCSLLPGRTDMDAPGSGPTPSPIETVALDLAQDAPQTYEAAEASANALLLAPDEVPGGVWQPGGPVERDEFRQTVCGVDTEPHPPAGSFVARRVTPQGLSLFQSIRPIGQARASDLVSRLRAATASCGEDVRPTGTYTITPVALADPAVLAYRQEQSGQPIITFQVFLTQRDSLVNFTTFSASPEPPTEFLDALVAAQRAKG